MAVLLRKAAALKRICGRCAPQNAQTIRPTIDNTERRVLTASEQSHLLSFIRQEEYRNIEPAITTLLGTGLRIGELLGLKWQDLDLESKEKTLTVNRTLVRIRDKKYFTFQEPKTASGTRTIPLQESVVKALKRQKVNQARYKLSGKWNPQTEFEGLVFSGKKGQPQWRSCIAESLDKIIFAMNEEEKERAVKEHRAPVIMEHINLHACRHSFATRCLEAGIAPKIVQSWLGHSSIEITLDLYSHVNQDVSFENMRRLEALYSEAI